MPAQSENKPTQPIISAASQPIGWVKFHRELLTKPIWHTTSLAAIAEMCGPGPSEIGSRMFVETGEEALIRRCGKSVPTMLCPWMRLTEEDPASEMYMQETSMYKGNVDIP